MLTTAQQTALRSAIKADSNLTALLAARDINGICTYLQNDSSIVVYRSTTQASDIYDAVAWANLTPTDAPDGTQVWMDRALMCQCKQMNLQILIQGKDSLNTAKANIRAGLQDALTNIPSGVSGATASGGWGSVKTAISRLASKYEAVFATGTGTAASPSGLGIEGYPAVQDVGASLFDANGAAL